MARMGYIMKIVINFINASDVFEDNNQGYIYGIDYIDVSSGDIIEEEWYKTEFERDNSANASGYQFIEYINK